MKPPLLIRVLLVVAAGAMLLSKQSFAEIAPDVLHKVGIEQRLDSQLPLSLKFRDESGATVHLSDYFDRQPVILVLAYYRCPMLCTQVLNGLVKSVRDVDFELGKQFRIVTVSIDPREGPELATQKKATYAEAYGRPGADAGWHFLTGDKESIDELAKAVGFRYAFDAETDQFAHGSGIMVATPQGRLSHYFLGIDYPSRDFHLALVEASQGRIGTAVDQLLLLCYHFDPATGKYSASAITFVRIAGIITMLAIGIPIGRAWYRDWRRGQIAAAAR